MKNYKLIFNKKAYIVIFVVIIIFMSFVFALNFSSDTNDDFYSLIVTKNPVIGYTGTSVDVSKSFTANKASIDYIPLDSVETESTTEIVKNESYQKPKKTSESKTESKTSPRIRNVIYDPSLTIENSGYSIVKSLGNHKLTFYCPCEKCCEKDPSDKYYGITATGTTATEGRTIAVDPRYIPYGSKVFIEGFGIFIAEDCGGSIKNARIDVFKTTHERALQLGEKYANAYIVS